MEWLQESNALSEQVRWIVEERLEWLGMLNRKNNRVECRLMDFTSEDPVVLELFGLARIGPVTAWTIRAGVGRFDRFR